MATSEARSTLCTTYDAAAHAASQLSSHSILILYCQGRELGLPDGELSIVALSDAAASHVFLFDVLALSDKYNPTLSPLFSLLHRRDITKIVWDCRTYLLELADTYGVLLQGVIDLQLLEVSTRGNNEKSLRVQHTTRHFRRIIDSGLTPPGDIHKLLGLDHCGGLYHVSQAGKNGE
ncbi:hypothetical protein K466DRAFT_503440 [Polyporus arcularius HHB13444]|uniref:3'-5' exonuclease domain-containing protein n=1 Tax=Polyporus arcularius HHB13444 TaxID=1314778 RepID=A0A5C3NTM3_9APHY|nr:hypothetical protein K466DRAFT_503440 [Polyporus arcularius HHB13444]